MLESCLPVAKSYKSNFQNLQCTFQTATITYYLLFYVCGSSLLSFALEQTLQIGAYPKLLS